MVTHTLPARCALALALAVAACAAPSTARPSSPAPVELTRYERPETRELVRLVGDAARLVSSEGVAAFAQLRTPGSRWRQGDRYVFVLGLDGTMKVHPDRGMEGRNQLALLDVNGRPIVRGLLHAATARPGTPEGWYHYEWPAPGELLPRWKSSYVRLVTTPAGEPLVIGAGIYDNRMERPFVVDLVNDAVAELEARGEAAFAALRDRAGPYVVKDTYVFVIDPSGIERVNPAFANLEGRDVRDLRDTRGAYLVRAMLDVARNRGSGWVDYMWPKPGDSVSTRKSTFVRRARVGGTWYLVGCGVYLADAPRGPNDRAKLSAPALTSLVREAAAVLARRGEDALPAFRERGSRWFRDDTYLFVWSLDGRRLFHAADRSLEGKDGSHATDSQGRPYGRMILDVARSASGEGWVHYLFPEPGRIFPVWKSTFLTRVRFPSGADHVVGAGIYDMQMDRAFIEDVVGRAVELVRVRGAAAFPELRDRHGSFVFMDTYVFVDRLDGTELVNPAQPSLEGKNLMALTDARGKHVVADYIAAAVASGAAWVDYDWYRPGENTPSRKHAFVRTVSFGDDTYVVGSGLYEDLPAAQDGTGSRPVTPTR